jgi:hypothetical protein
MGVVSSEHVYRSERPLRGGRAERPMSDDGRDGRREIAAGGDRNRADWPTGLGRDGRRQAGRGDRPRYCVLVFLSGAFHSSSRWCDRRTRDALQFV